MSDIVIILPSHHHSPAQEQQQPVIILTSVPELDTGHADTPGSVLLGLTLQHWKLWYMIDVTTHDQELIGAVCAAMEDGRVE